MARELDAAWWEPFHLFARELEEHVLDPCFEEGLHGYNCDLSLEDVDQETDDPLHAKGLIFGVEIKERPGELVGGADDGSLISNGLCFNLTDMLSLLDPDDPAQPHLNKQIEFNSLVDMDQDGPHVSITGRFRNVFVDIRIYAEIADPTTSDRLLIDSRNGGMRFRLLDDETGEHDEDLED